MKHLILMSLIAVVSSRKITLQCAPGSHVHTPRIGPDICRWCTEGVNFMPRYPEFWHSNRTCFNCTQVRDENLEVKTSPCNRTHDAEILCREGYYRQMARNIRENDICVKCSYCENIARPCQGYFDNVCCLPSYDVVLNKHGFYECKERPIVCGAGEFLSLKTEQCTPCPPGTFMTSDKHNNTSCLLCETLDDVTLYHEIFQPCNQTHTTIFGCQEGYFSLVSDATKENVSLCQPCTKCGDQQNEVRKCDRFQDTICYDSAEMLVQETEQEPRFLSSQMTDNFNNTGDSKNTNSSWYTVGLILGLSVIVFIIFGLRFYAKTLLTWVIKTISKKIRKLKLNSPSVCYGVYSIIDQEETVSITCNHNYNQITEEQNTNWPKF